MFEDHPGVLLIPFGCTSGPRRTRAAGRAGGPAGLVAGVLALLAAGPKAGIERGVHQPRIRNRRTPADAAHLTPPERPFPWKLRPLKRDAGIRVGALTFPSPLPSPYPVNNTVHAEYYLPVGARGVPGVVVLHILADPGFRVSRLVSEYLARRGIATLLVFMAYYGPRRPPGLGLAMLSDDPAAILEAWRQSIWDVRWAASWLASRPEIDADRIGLAGTSLGAIVGATVVSIDARFRRAALVLGGGDLAAILWTSPETRILKQRLVAKGLSIDAVRRRLAPIEPLRFANPAIRDGILMINALRDETIPRASTDRLREALGRPEIRWYDTTHVGTVVGIVDILLRVAAHFAPERFDADAAGP